MTEQEQRISIAEFCGYSNINTFAPLWFENSDSHRFIPDYLHDLNAIHEVESKFLVTATFDQITFWLDNLYRAKGLNPYVWRNAYGSGKTDPTPPVEMAKIVNLNAPQRAEALLRTIGKWKE